MANKGAWFFDKNAAGEFVVSQAGYIGLTDGLIKRVNE